MEERGKEQKTEENEIPEYRKLKITEVKLQNNRSKTTWTKSDLTENNQKSIYIYFKLKVAEI